MSVCLAVSSLAPLPAKKEYTLRNALLSVLEHYQRGHDALLVDYKHPISLLGSFTQAANDGLTMAQTLCRANASEIASANMQFLWLGKSGTTTYACNISLTIVVADSGLIYMHPYWNMEGSPSKLNQWIRGDMKRCCSEFALRHGKKTEVSELEYNMGRVYTEVLFYHVDWSAYPPAELITWQ